MSSASCHRKNPARFPSLFSLVATLFFESQTHCDQRAREEKKEPLPKCPTAFIR